jgi:hypothetical protein
MPSKSHETIPLSFNVRKVLTSLILQYVPWSGRQLIPTQYCISSIKYYIDCSGARTGDAAFPINNANTNRNINSTTYHNNSNSLSHSYYTITTGDHDEGGYMNIICLAFLLVKVKGKVSRDSLSTETIGV